MTGRARVAAAAEAGWRTFEVTTKVEVVNPSGITRVWRPLPLASDTDWHKTLGNNWKGNGTLRSHRDEKYGATLLYAEWPATEKAPLVEIVCQDARLRHRRHPRHARDQEPRWQVRRPQRAVRRARAGRRGPRPRSVRHPHRDSKEFKSLGKSGDITKAQHCRAEFYVQSHGWVPVDPADVRKVVLEEKPGPSSSASGR